MRPALDILSFLVAVFAGMVAGWDLERGHAAQGYAVLAGGAFCFLALTAIARLRRGCAR